MKRVREIRSGTTAGSANSRPAGTTSAAFRLKSLLLFVLLLLIGLACYAQPYFGWAKQIGGTSDEIGNSVAVDAAGNVYTTGNFKGTADFDPGAGTYPLTANEAGATSIFVSKLDASGNLVWARKMGGSTSSSSVTSNAIAVDANGNVYTTGQLWGTADFDPGSSAHNLVSSGSGDLFISKLDAAGNFVWTKKIGGAKDDAGRAVATDASGNILLTGYSTGPVDFDPGPNTVTLSGSVANMFVLKLAASGDFLWVKQMSSSYDIRGYAITVDNAGNVYTTGHFWGATDFDPGPGSYSLGVVRNFDVFVSKLDASGNFVWARSMGGDGRESGASIAVDAGGNVYTTGNFNTTVDFDPGPGLFTLTPIGGSITYDAFISKLDAAGNFVWARRMGAPDFNDAGASITVDASGSVYAIGSFFKISDFGALSLSACGEARDIYLAKLNPAGNFLWAKKLGGCAEDICCSIAVDASGTLYITGNFVSTADFNPEEEGVFELTAAGGSDVFIYKTHQQVNLPVVLSRFGVAPSGSTNVLSWRTVSEQNTASFTVERSADGRLFLPIGALPAAGNSAAARQYSFTDLRPIKSLNFYRLKMADNDGTVAYSRVVSVSRQAAGKELDVYPVPAAGVLYIRATGDGAATLLITDAAGRLMKQQQIRPGGNTALPVNVQSLVPGKYFLVLQQGAESKTASFVKQ